MASNGDEANDEGDDDRLDGLEEAVMTSLKSRADLMSPWLAA